MAHGLVGVELFNAGRHAEALAHLERAVEIRPRFVRTRINLAAALIDAGRLDEAALQLNEARQLDAVHPDTRFYSAVLLQRRGQRAAAIRAYRSLLRDVPDHEGAARQLRALGR